METKTKEKYYYTEKCKEISGFGGGYEATCRKMVIAGMNWFDKHKKANPKVQTFEGIMGLSIPKNNSAKELEKVMLEASGNDCTGAMMQACTNHVFYAMKNGWDKYIEEMEKGN